MSAEPRQRVVVVSNRLPLTLKRAGDGWETSESSGGLATAMNPILRGSSGIWIGWSGDATTEPDAERARVLESWEREHGYFAVDLPPEVVTGFYEGYSNQTLWPLFHHFPGLFNFNPEDWAAYREANQRFCDEALEHIQPGDLVWVHDYQLMLLPQMLREARPDAQIGFFLHIPFPSSSVFRLLPRREELLHGLLGADYLAFHTYSYLQNFRTSVLRVLGLESRIDRILQGGRSVRLEALPIGIATKEFTEQLHGDEETINRLAELQEQFKDKRVLLSVDRLDYTKGIPERFRTFHRLLRETPELRGHVVLIQVAVPSREKIPMYEELQQETNELVGQINGEYGAPDWTPIVYIRRGIARSELAALYRMADVGWVAPLRDGMNLVAKEFVACKEGTGGVLVLSEFAGAASEMGEALLVNPYDEERTAETLRRALEMDEDEQRERMAALFRRVTRNNVFRWSERFIFGVSDAVAERTERWSDMPAELNVGALTAAYHQAEKRLLLFDYDGTLVGYAKRPQDAAPPQSLIETLARLAGDERNRIALVSGRSRRDLDGWFGGIKNLWLAAEHGAVMRSPVTNEWEPYRTSYTNDWKDGVRAMLEDFTDRMPGSLIEEKEFSLVWHYRMADPEFGEWLANELVANLEQMLAETELRAYHGRKTVEIKLVWANKGEVLARLESDAPGVDFLFAAGDDRTDEDMFERLPREAWTIHVGGTRSRARFRVDDTIELRRVLDGFGAEAKSAPATSTG